MVVLTRYEKPLPGPWPGCAQVGEIELEPGVTIPLYDTEPPENRLSINTAEGWNAIAERIEREYANRLPVG